MLEPGQSSVTQQGVKKFLDGKITWAQLVGVGAEQAAAIAELGHTQFKQGKLRSAQKIFEGLAAMNPKDSYFSAVLGAIYAQQGKMDEALLNLNLAVSSGSRDPQVYLNRAEIHLSNGRFIEAQDDLRLAIDNDPDKESSVVLRAKTMAATTARLIEEIVEKK